jgi:hypothetical protein
MEKYGQLFESVFKEKLTDAAVVSHLEKIAAEHPYFSIAQFYLLLQSPKNTPAYRAQAKKTAVLFNNNYWLNFQLLEAGTGKLQNSATEQNLPTAPVETAAAGFIEAKPFEEEQEESLPQTEAETGLEDNAGELTAAETEADSTAVYPPEIPGNEPTHLSTSIPGQGTADEGTMTEAPEEEPADVPATAAFTPHEIPDGKAAVEPPAITEDTRPAVMREPITNEPAAPVEALTENRAQEITVYDVPENVPPAEHGEIRESHLPQEQAPIITAEPATALEAVTEDAAETISTHIEAENQAAIVPPAAALPNEVISEATLPEPTVEPADATLAIDEPVTEETDKTNATAPIAFPPGKAAGELLFEPLHTSDYFASVGIKLSEEEKTADKLGKQLKSFTDWLKTMKKIPAGQASRALQPLEATPSVADSSIQKLAEQSNQGNEVLTEAMAAVLLQQGRQDKAIEILQKLSLLDPAKSAYFAAKINQIKEN